MPILEKNISLLAILAETYSCQDLGKITHPENFWCQNTKTSH